MKPEYHRWPCDELKRKLRAERAAKTRIRHERDRLKEKLRAVRQDYNTLAGNSL